MWRIKAGNFSADEYSQELPNTIRKEYIFTNSAFLILTRCGTFGVRMLRTGECGLRSVVKVVKSVV